VYLQVTGAGRQQGTIAGDTHEVLPCQQPAAGHPADGRGATVFVIVQRGDQHLQRRLGVDTRGRHVAQDRVEQGFEVRPEVRAQARPPRDGVGVDHLKIGLLVSGAKLEKEVKGAIQRVVGVGVPAIHLVDHHDDAVVHGERLFQDETRLRHGPLGGIHQQQHAVHHVEHPLDLATEIGMAGSVHDVDLDLTPREGVPDGNRRVLGQDGDPALALQGIRVEHALDHLLVLAKDARLFEHGVHQGGLAVVDVGDDGQVAEALDGHGTLVGFSACGDGRGG